MPKTKIELTEEEMEVFRWCWQNYRVWKLARELKPGRLVLHFDKDNELKKPEFHYYGDKTLDTLSG